MFRVINAFFFIVVFAIGIAFSQAALLVFTGLYGDANDIGMVKCGLLVLQIGLSSVVTLLFDEILQKGYGIGSGINLFVAANVAQTIFWNLLSLSTVPTVRGNEYEGALISLFQLVMSRSDKSRALKDAFYRTDLPNFMSVVATVVIFCAAAYLQGLRIELPVKSNRLRSQQAKYPIKLLYTSCMPIMLQSAMFANILFVSQILYVYFGSNFLVRVLGVWEPLGETNQLFATGGVAYYLSPPRGFLDAVISPFHTFVYTSIVITTCAFLSKIWMEISGSSTRDVAKQLKDQQLTISGFRDVSMHKELKRVIPIAASFGGAVLAVISVFGDVVGAIGTGAGVLMCVIIIFQYFEMFVQEQMEGNMTMESMMAGAQ
jgi:protein transport protein SEC61 subunit alpha